VEQKALLMNIFLRAKKLGDNINILKIITKANFPKIHSRLQESSCFSQNFF